MMPDADVLSPAVTFGRMSSAVRDATADDLVDIVELYNALIPTTTIGWSERLETLPQREVWFKQRQAAGDAVLVAEDGAGNVIGFAAYGPFRDNERWEGYRFTVENTVHVSAAHQSRGVGRALMTTLFERARAHGKHVMVAAVDADSAHSLRFHERLGFVEVGRLSEVGYKFDRWLTLVLLQRVL